MFECTPGVGQGSSGPGHSYPKREPMSSTLGEVGTRWRCAAAAGHLDSGHDCRPGFRADLRPRSLPDPSTGGRPGPRPRRRPPGDLGGHAGTGRQEVHQRPVGAGPGRPGGPAAAHPLGPRRGQRRLPARRVGAVHLGPRRPRGRRQTPRATARWRACGCCRPAAGRPGRWPKPRPGSTWCGSPATPARWCTGPASTRAPTTWRPTSAATRPAPTPGSAPCCSRPTRSATGTTTWGRGSRGCSRRPRPRPTRGG